MLKDRHNDNPPSLVIFKLGNKKIFVALFNDEDGCKIAMFVESQAGSLFEGLFQSIVTPDFLTEQQLTNIRAVLMRVWQAELVEYRPL